MTKTTNTTYLTVKASSSTTSTTDLNWKEYKKCPSPWKPGVPLFFPCIGWKRDDDVLARSVRVCIPSHNGHNCYQSYPDGDITCNPSYNQIDVINDKLKPNCNFTGKSDHYTGVPRLYRIDNGKVKSLMI